VKRQYIQKRVQILWKGKEWRKLHNMTIHLSGKVWKKILNYMAIGCEQTIPTK
jgi:hypothetical protein